VVAFVVLDRGRLVSPANAPVAGRELAHLRAAFTERHAASLRAGRALRRELTGDAGD
jgi:hypothetical protein